MVRSAAWVQKVGSYLEGLIATWLVGELTMAIKDVEAVKDHGDGKGECAMTEDWRQDEYYCSRYAMLGGGGDRRGAGGKTLGRVRYGTVMQRPIAERRYAVY